MHVFSKVLILRLASTIIFGLLLAFFQWSALPASGATGTYVGADSTGPSVVVFSNETFTDEDEEDTDIRITLVSISKTVEVFDGGDGSSTAWQTALSGVDVLVWPERSGLEAWASADTSVLTSGAKAYIKSWVESGKLIVGTGSYTHYQMISDLTGIDFTGLGKASLSSYGDPWARFSSNTSLPDSVPAANYTGGISNYSSLSSAQKAVLERVYYDSSTDNVAVANFTVGSGYYVYNAYDWYPSPSDVSSGRRAEWDATLQFAASGAVTGQSFGVEEAESSSQPLLSLPKIDSIFPTRVVAGETISIIGKRWTCTTTSTYTSSSSPVAHGWLTPQLEQIDFKVPEDQPTGPLQFTLNSCAGPFEINGLVTVVPAPMSITYLLDDSNDLFESMTDVKAVSALHRGDYTKAHCIVNSQVSEAEKIQVGYELCSTAMAQMPQGSRMEVTLRSNYLGDNTWTRVWFGN